MELIKLENLTKDYGDSKGIFDISMSIEKGEVVGFVGINGAGKTTTIRHLMGYLRPDKGKVTINGFDCWKESEKVNKLVGYIPGEITFPNAATGTDFLNSYGKLWGEIDESYRDEIIKLLQLDHTANLKRMSKGMKQKTAIVAALMTNPQILILDEPTTGLDPLMRSQFVDLILKEKKAGKTILMSSHMFEEVEKTCDKVVIIKDGQILSVKSVEEIRNRDVKSFDITCNDGESINKINSAQFEVTNLNEENLTITIEIANESINELFKILRGCSVKNISENKYTFDDYFKDLTMEGK